MKNKPKPILKKVDELTINIAEKVNFFGCGLTFFLMVVIMRDVTGRLLFNSPLTGTTELVIAIITIIAWSQATYVQSIDAHLKVNIISGKFSYKTKKIMNIIEKTLGVLIFSLLSYNLWYNLLRSIKTAETEGEGALILPMWPVRGLIFIFAVFFTIIMIIQIINTINDNEPLKKFSKIKKNKEDKEGLK